MMRRVLASWLDRAWFQRLRIAGQPPWSATGYRMIAAHIADTSWGQKIRSME